MNFKKPDYEFLEHTADLGIIVRGDDIQTLFETAAMALMHILVKGRSSQTPVRDRLSVSADDTDDLMVRWLSEILYLLEGEEMVVTGVKIPVIYPSSLEAVIEKVPFDPEIHEIQREIKAVTYHQINVSPIEGRWQARIIFDV
ncbi:archease [Thermodesulfobacteriota bacterium]